MKHPFEISLCAAVASLALVCPQFGMAQTTSAPQSNAATNSTMGNTRGQSNTGQSPTGANIGSQPGAQAGYGNGQAYTAPSAQANQENMGRQTGAENGNGRWNQGARNENSAFWAQNEARTMVPATASLNTTINATSAHRGEPIRATLTGNVQLKNGPELPKGTVLEGKVTQDQSESNHVRVALAFNQARLNDGRTVPVKAMVIGFPQQMKMGYENGPAINKKTGQNNALAPGRDNGYAAGTNRGYIPPTNESASQMGQQWKSDRLSVYQHNAIDGATLHSSVYSRNSAVLSSHHKNEVKVPAGTQMELALATRPMQPMGQGQPMGRPGQSGPDAAAGAAHGNH